LYIYQAAQPSERNVSKALKVKLRNVRGKLIKTTVQHPTDIKPTNKKLVTSKTVFTVTIVVTTLTILSIWLFGLGQHRTIFENSLLSTSILSVAFFLFLTIGLFKGIKLKDNLGKITTNLKPTKIPDLTDGVTGVDFIPVSDGIEGIILSIVLWVVVTISIAVFFWLFGAVVWTGVIIFIAMLYWIFFRALRLVFKNSNKCKGDLTTSILYGLGYTTLYNFWIYGVILATHYLIK